MFIIIFICCPINVNTFKTSFIRNNGGKIVKNLPKKYFRNLSFTNFKQS